ncbi:MAG: bacillithiol biosynthesis cysteine-adding enzyme BshC [Limnohabitans sp.]|nr:bacillithiol biosynthesis cysteine-adding enzyme BshC [Limnohabitans sp.]
MPTDCITYQNSGYFSQLIIDYLDEKQEIQSLYHRFPKIENFLPQLEEKSKNYSESNRKILVEALLRQNQKINVSQTTINNISLLNHSNTFTITTGHQLNLFTGPLYFIYKIVSTINLCKELKLEYPEYNFVPVYWMATEDHDFEEINHFKFKGKKITWNKTSKGPVGRLSTDGLHEIYESFSNELGLGENATFLKNLFRKAYVENGTLADATRFLVNELFKEEGLVIIDGDDKSLKQLFSPVVKKELTEQISYKSVTETIKDFTYDIQVNPREINLFYIEDHLRERIIFEKNYYKINNTSLVFTQEEILNLVENSSEKFSPNVILRPLYQELLLPNLCYIGGGGEIAYWLELKKMFDALEVTFPILLLRNSAIVTTEKQLKKIEKLQLSWEDLFTKQDRLITAKTKELSQFKIDFSEQKETLRLQFEKLHQIAAITDKSFTGAVKAQETKQIKGLENLEKRLLKAEKRVLQELLSKISELQNELFPNQSLQERQLNFSEIYIEFGHNFIQNLFTNTKPLSNTFLNIHQ